MTQNALKTACCSLLFLASIRQGLQDVPVFHYKTKEVLVGQNTSLPCLIENIDSKMNIVSTEWIKKTTKLVVYTPIYGYTYFVPNVTLNNIYDGSDKLIGTNLELSNIDKGDAGTYICGIASFPDGSLRSETELTVKDKIECDMNSTIDVNSGENVTIHCKEFSDVTYTWSKDEVKVSDSASLQLLSLSGANAGLYTLTVNTGNRLLQATFTIAVSSQTTDYRADATSLSPYYHNSSSGGSQAVSHSPVTAFATEDKPSSTTAIPDSHSQSNESQHTSASTMYMTSVTFTQPESNDGFNRSKAYHTTLNYNHTQGFDTASQHVNQSRAVNTDLSYNHSGTTTPPFAHDRSTEYGEINDTSAALNKTKLPDDSLLETFTTSAPSTAASLTSTPGSTTDATVQQDPPVSEGPSHLVLTLSIIGGAVLIIVALMLYRRRVIKKRMDLPPPFKPPPPPVKYTAARSHQQQYPIDRCNSVTVGVSMEIRHSFV